ncbi:SPOR domain-containing protein [Geothermobacter hydrogeniphilus]|uniref:SPOR domain-containing protein n=1 Tax=Geothermobacter hydrogeniphilus TaxID=1969733 RepID=A0A1X0XXC0_9BACT|nr:SPOR domain-containing protein [Geothermobacter hydrogeniphilus]ORJ57561.1 hypothetical protein B5V00_13160 [Geothermobacter hydrogeniphilus]
MSGRDDENFGFETEKASGAEEEEFTLAVTDEESGDGPKDRDLFGEELFTIADDEVLISDEAETGFEVEEPVLPPETAVEEEEVEAEPLFGDAGDAEVIFDPGEEEVLPPVRRGSPAKLVLLVLVLLLAGALGFYFFTLPANDTSSTRMPVVKSSAKQPIVPPQKKTASNLPAVSAAPRAAVGETAAADVAVSGKTVRSSQTKPEPADGPVKVAAATGKKTVEPDAGKHVPSSSPVVKKVPAASLEKAVVKVPAVSKQAKRAPAPARAVARYRVQVGAFLLKSNLHAAEKKVRQLGFTPVLSEARKKSSMTRLKYGSFSPEEGRRKLAELKKIDADAFVLHEGDRLGVYAGSYLDLDKARHYADLLWEKGIHVDEVPVEVDVPLHRLSLGGFTDRESARAAAEKAKKAGLEARVIALRNI